MSVSVDVIFKGLPKEKIEDFEDKVVYNVAVETREFTKGQSAYPYLTGELARQQIKAPITGSNGNYNLLDGVKYAKYVWKMTNVNWTNQSTKPQWYKTVFRQKEKTIVDTAMQRAGGELK